MGGNSCVHLRQIERPRNIWTINIKVIGYNWRGIEMDRTGSESCQILGFGNCDVEPSGFN
jgi:hypothetical protein